MKKINLVIADSIAFFQHRHFSTTAAHLEFKKLIGKKLLNNTFSLILCIYYFGHRWISQLGNGKQFRIHAIVRHLCKIEPLKLASTARCCTPV